MEKTAELIEEAKNHPNGWVYVLDKDLMEKKKFNPNS